jgi:hypothetical protein
MNLRKIKSKPKVGYICNFHEDADALRNHVGMMWDIPFADSLIFPS